MIELLQKAPSFSNQP